jgi:hypothetical protein
MQHGNRVALSRVVFASLENRAQKFLSLQEHCCPSIHAFFFGACPALCNFYCWDREVPVLVLLIGV